MNSNRQVTTKMFVNYINHNSKTPEQFLATHREYITTGELASQLSPILNQVDNKQISANAACINIASIAKMHLLRNTKSESQKKSIGLMLSKKPVSATIFDINGNVVFVLNEDNEEKPLSSRFDHIQQAERWAYNRLASNEVDNYAEIVCDKILIKGVPWNIKIDRPTAIYQLRKINKTPFMHVNKSSGDMKKMKVNPKKYSFSHA